MRVIAGMFGGRNISAPRGHRTHPMSEKMRGAIFNALGDISGLSILDAFSGSGALSIEAISRGASHATAIDNDKTAFDTISENLKSLQIKDKIQVIQANAGSWSDNNADASYDIVMLDPSYDKVNEELLVKIASHAKVQGTIIISLPPDAAFILPETNYKLLTTKNYGDSRLDFYRKT